MKKPSHKAAVQRAEVLLREHLSPDQLVDYDKSGGFNVKGSDGHWYRVNKPYLHGVEQFAAEAHNVVDEVGVGYCTFPFAYPDTPWPDIMLAQKLYLETGAEKYMALSCTSSKPEEQWGYEYGVGVKRLPYDVRVEKMKERQVLRQKRRMEIVQKREQPERARIVVKMPNPPEPKPPMMELLFPPKEDSDPQLRDMLGWAIVALVIAMTVAMVLLAVNIL